MVFLWFSYGLPGKDDHVHKLSIDYPYTNHILKPPTNHLKFWDRFVAVFAHIFLRLQVDWQGDSYSLQPAEEATLQAGEADDGKGWDKSHRTGMNLGFFHNITGMNWEHSIYNYM